MSIHIAPKAWPSGSARSRVYMKPWSSIGLMSAVPPFAAAALFIASTAWPLADKMTRSNFPPGPIARLNELPVSDIAWFNAGRHPAQGVIAVSNSTEQAITESGYNTTAAISIAGDSTGTALSTAQDSTGNALQKSYRHTKHALGISARHVGEALHVTPKDVTPQ